MIIQFCGLSGAGKTTIARGAKQKLKEFHIPVEIIDGDEYRTFICKDLGFSRADRMETYDGWHLLRTHFQHTILQLLCAPSIHTKVRRELVEQYDDVRTIYIRCGIDELKRRDTKGLYKKAMLPEGHRERVNNLTGVNDPFEEPAEADLIIDTDHESTQQSIDRLVEFIRKNVKV